MFYMQKLVSQFFFPLTFCLGCILAGIVMLWFTERQFTGKLFVTAGLILLGLFSYESTANRILRPLEGMYTQPEEPDKSIRWIVVLGGGMVSDPELPITSRLSEATLIRLVEALRLSRKMPDARLVLCGGTVFDTQPEALGMAELVRELGFDDIDFITETKSRNTLEQSFAVQKIVGEAPFALVTSASHMPRSMGFFKALDMKPIPFPADHKVKQTRITHPSMYFPGAQGLRKTCLAFYEYMGLLRYRIFGDL